MQVNILQTVHWAVNQMWIRNLFCHWTSVWYSTRTAHRTKLAATVATWRCLCNANRTRTMQIKHGMTLLLQMICNQTLKFIRILLGQWLQLLQQDKEVICSLQATNCALATQEQECLSLIQLHITWGVWSHMTSAAAQDRIREQFATSHKRASLLNLLLIRKLEQKAAWLVLMQIHNVINNWRTQKKHELSSKTARQRSVLRWSIHHQAQNLLLTASKLLAQWAATHKLYQHEQLHCSQWYSYQAASRDTESCNRWILVKNYLQRNQAQQRICVALCYFAGCKKKVEVLGELVNVVQRSAADAMSVVQVEVGHMEQDWDVKVQGAIQLQLDFEDVSSQLVQMQSDLDTTQRLLENSWEQQQSHQAACTTKAAFRLLQLDQV